MLTASWLRRYRSRRRSLAPIVVSALISISSPAAAWGPNGHAIVADIAEANLSDPMTGSPTTMAEIHRLLATDAPPAGHLADIASWADDWRAHGHKETSQWHFVDIPLHAPGYDEARDCHNDPSGKERVPEATCVVAKIVEFADVLRDRSRGDAERVQALKFLVHFVGDIHQPLHAEDNADRGGNDVEEPWHGRAERLHTIWDSAIIQSEFGLHTNKVYSVDQAAARAVADRVRGSISAGDVKTWAPFGVAGHLGDAAAGWANESHALAPAAYDRLGHAGTPGWEDAYVAWAAPLVNVQLEKAGVRLAELLRETLP